MSTTLKDIIMEELAKGPKLLNDIVQRCKGTSYTQSSIATLMSQLKRNGVINSRRAEEDSLRLCYFLPEDPKAPSVPEKKPPTAIMQAKAAYSMPASRGPVVRGPIKSDYHQLLKPSDMIILSTGAALMTTEGLFSFVTGERVYPAPEEVLDAKRITGLQADIVQTVRL